MTKLQAYHHHLLLALAKQGFIFEKTLLQQFPPSIIHDLEKDGYIARSKYNSYYNTKLAASYLRAAMARFSPRLTTLDMLHVLQNAPAYVVVDIETTGGSAGRGDKIVEIAALKIQNGQQIDLFHRFINPQKPIKNSHIHGITNERVKNEPTIDVVIKEFASFLGDLPIVSHHIQFDWYSFLALELFQHGYPIHNQACCTVMLAKKFLISPKYRLNVLAETYNIPLLKHHTADADAICANELLQIILTKAKQEMGPPIVQQSLEMGFANTSTIYVSPDCKVAIAKLNHKNYLDVTYKELSSLVTYGLDGYSKMREPELNKLLSDDALRLIETQFIDTKSRNSMKRWFLRGLSIELAAKKAYLEQNFRLIERAVYADITYPFVLHKKTS